MYIDASTFEIGRNRREKDLRFSIITRKGVIFETRQSQNADFHDLFQTIKPHTKMCFQPYFVVLSTKYDDALRQRNVIRN